MRWRCAMARGVDGAAARTRMVCCPCTSAPRADRRDRPERGQHRTAGRQLQRHALASGHRRSTGSGALSGGTGDDGAEGSGLIDPALQPVPDGVLCVDARCRAGRADRRRALRRRPCRRSRPGQASSRMRLNAGKAAQRNGAIRWTGFITAAETGAHRVPLCGERRLSHLGRRPDGGGRLGCRTGGPSIATGADGARGGASLCDPGRGLPARRQRRRTADVEHAGGSGRCRRRLTAAREADVVVFAAGLTACRSRARRCGCRRLDSSAGTAPASTCRRSQQRLLEQVAAVGQAGHSGADERERARRRIGRTATCPPIIEAWYPGGQGGDAVARLIAGDFSPAGRLPVTFYRSVEDLPPFSDYAMNNRTYRYFERRGPLSVRVRAVLFQLRLFAGQAVAGPCARGPGGGGFGRRDEHRRAWMLTRWSSSTSAAPTSPARRSGRSSGSSAFIWPGARPALWRSPCGIAT